MVNRKQTDGQSLCICNHKEFHHRKTYDGKNICCMGGCDCEHFIKLVHYKDICSKESECKANREKSLNIEEVSCLECLNLVKREWERQVREFGGQPRLNAVAGLKETIKRISQLKTNGEAIPPITKVMGILAIFL